MANQSDEDKYFRVALELQIVEKAGRLVKDAFHQPMDKVETKTSNIDLVTETDKAVEKLIVSELSRHFPSHKFIGEETAATGEKYELTNAPTWIIDPIDGTTNFVHRIGFVAICVGLTINKELRAGIVYNPISGDLYSAQKGRGALRNGFPIHVSSTETISAGIIASSLGIHNIVEKGEKWLSTAQGNQLKITKAGTHGPSSEVERAVSVLQLGSDRSPALMTSFANNFKTLMGERQMLGHRSFGSAAINMVYVAQGSVDAYVEYGLHCWDIAAAAIIVTEAGGVVLDPTGAEFNLMSRKVLCAGTEKLARELSGILTHVDYEPECIC